MIDALPPLLAQSVVHSTFRWGRIEQPSDWLLPGIVLAAVLAYAVWMYRKDAVELRPLVAKFLTFLRIAALIGIFLLWLEPGIYRERETLQPSHVDILIDTSSSMSITDGNSASRAGTSRLSQALDMLTRPSTLKAVRDRHEVRLFRFDRELKEIGRFPRLVREGEGREIAGDEVAPTDWVKELSPGGDQTRLGDALARLAEQTQDHPPAAVMVITDGASNAGVPAEDPGILDRLKSPVHAVGVGKTEEPRNVSVERLEVVKRIYPGDPCHITGLLRQVHAEGTSVDVELLVRPASRSGEEGTGEQIAAKRITMPAEALVSVPFQHVFNDLGRFILCLKIRSEAAGDATDDLAEVVVEVVDRRNRVLLFAGGPTRDYQFARSVLWRDPTIESDVFLQTGQPGMSQEGRRILDQFPASLAELAEYDVVFAFDPDWSQLPVEAQRQLEQWVTQQGGGLIVEAGNVHMGTALGGWTQNPDCQVIRNLLPVELQRSVGVTEVLAYSGAEAWPLAFTEEGWNATYLWLEDTPEQNVAAWESFEGVYSCHISRRPKPAAVVLAYFGDPSLGSDNQRPVYLAEQFYGAGRVLFVGSGELWRLRTVKPAYFERLVVNLVRHCAEGRLARQSNRGVLLVSPDDCSLGTTVTLRAQVLDTDFQPYRAADVEAEVLSPEHNVQTIRLAAEPGRPGMFVGHLPVVEEGTYRVSLRLPDGGEERLSQEIRVRVPELEKLHAAQDKATLERIAEATGGRYVPLESLDAATWATIVDSLPDRSRIVLTPIGIDRTWQVRWFGWMLGLIAACLSMEWLIRRLNRLA
ncbi:hypothetical protein JCM19992_19800 [Thermostilla marina]